MILHEIFCVVSRFPRYISCVTCRRIYDITRAGRAFLQALCVTRARVLSFPLRVPRSRVLFQSFFSRTKIHVPTFSRSKFCKEFQFRVLKKKIRVLILNFFAYLTNKLFSVPESNSLDKL